MADSGMLKRIMAREPVRAYFNVLSFLRYLRLKRIELAIRREIYAQRARNMRIVNTFPRKTIDAMERELLKIRQEGYRNARIYEPPKNPYPVFHDPEFYGLPRDED